MKKIIFLSDINGNYCSIQLANKLVDLEKNEVIKYDCRILGEIDNFNHKQKEEIHSAFIAYGIDNAVENLLSLEKEPITIVGFSIGGTIAWEYALRSKSVNEIICFSSTRLRHQNKKPNCKIKLLFGELDKYKPNNNWFKGLDLKPVLVKSEGHEFYIKPNHFSFCSTLLSS